MTIAAKDAPIISECDISLIDISTRDILIRDASFMDASTVNVSADVISVTDIVFPQERKKNLNKLFNKKLIKNLNKILPCGNSTVTVKSWKEVMVPLYG